MENTSYGSFLSTEPLAKRKTHHPQRQRKDFHSVPMYSKNHENMIRFLEMKNWDVWYLTIKSSEGDMEHIFLLILL